jgi:choline kinase
MDYPIIIIPCAGVGRRMKSYGPKALIDLGGMTVLERQLYIAQEAYPKSEIFVICGFEKDKVEKHVKDWRKNRAIGSKDISVVYNDKYEQYGISYGISLAYQISCNKNCIIMYGDLVFNKEAFNFDFFRSGVVIDNFKQFKQQEVGVNIVNGLTTRFSYSFATKWAQIAYLSSYEAGQFCRLAREGSNLKKMPHELFNIMIDSGSKMARYENSKMVIAEIDSSKDIELAKEIHADFYIKQ